MKLILALIAAASAHSHICTLPSDHKYGTPAIGTCKEDSDDKLDQDVTREEIDPFSGHLKKTGGRYANIDPEEHIGPIIFSED